MTARQKYLPPTLRSGEGDVFNHVCLSIHGVWGSQVPTIQVPGPSPHPCASPLDMFKLVQVEPHSTAIPSLPDMFQLIHYVTLTVGKADSWYSTETASCSFNHDGFEPSMFHIFLHNSGERHISCRMSSGSNPSACFPTRPIT